MCVALALKSVGTAFGLLGERVDAEKKWIKVLRCRSSLGGVDYELSGIICIIAIKIEVAGGIAECIGGYRNGGLTAVARGEGGGVNGARNSGPVGEEATGDGDIGLDEIGGRF